MSLPEPDDPAQDHIESGEWLYRAVYANEVVRREDGSVEVKAEAFRDQHYRPSVDQASLREFEPHRTRDYFGADRAVVTLTAAQVRSISPLADYDSKGREVEGPQVDVEPVPLEDNRAHAEIFGKPAIHRDKLFKRLRLSLSRLAEQHPDRVLWPE